MNAGVSIVVPALGDTALLAAALEPLVREIECRAAGDEILVVDDTGLDRLAAWARGRWPLVRVLASDENQGFARALARGIHAARSPLCFAMNSDVRVRAGFLEPLCEELDDPQVFAAVPRILLGGSAGEVESLVRVQQERGIARAVQPALEEPGRGLSEELLRASLPVPFAIGGACLLRREAFERLGGFDPAFEPFYLEDLDLGWRAWRAGMQVRYVGRSVVEHHHRGTIGALFPEALVRTAIERNRLLFTWKHLDGRELLEQHVSALARRAAEAELCEDRIFLGALCLALEDLPSLERGAAGAPSFEAIQWSSDPLGFA